CAPFSSIRAITSSPSRGLAGEYETDVTSMVGTWSRTACRTLSMRSCFIGMSGALVVLRLFGVALQLELLHLAVPLFHRLDDRPVAVSVVVRETFMIIFPESVLVQLIGIGVIGRGASGVDHRRTFTKVIHRLESLLDALDLLIQLVTQ